MLRSTGSSPPAWAEVMPGRVCPGATSSMEIQGGWTGLALGPRPVDLLRAGSHVTYVHRYAQLPCEGLIWCGWGWGFSARKPEVALGPNCDPWERGQEREAGDELGETTPATCWGVSSLTPF